MVSTRRCEERGMLPVSTQAPNSSHTPCPTHLFHGDVHLYPLSYPYNKLARPRFNSSSFLSSQVLKNQPPAVTVHFGAVTTGLPVTLVGSLAVSLTPPLFSASNSASFLQSSLYQAASPPASPPPASPPFLLPCTHLLYDTPQNTACDQLK